MQPSSLIFVLVVAIWAVFLLQYWIKRRDHMSTVRSVDRFSAAMRILDDHRAARGTAEPTPRSYAVAPTRAARPEITVKHAEAPRTTAPQRISGVPRRVRGLTLLTMAVLLPVVALAAVFTPLPWWVAAAWLVGTVGAFAWLRQAVVAEWSLRARVAQRPPVRATRPAAPRVSAPVTATAPVAASAPVEEPVVRSTRLYDVIEDEDEAVAEPVVEPVADAPAAELEPGTWAPTPVPRPMYTMKAKAERPAPQAEVAPVEAAPVEAAAVAADIPQVIEVEDEELPAIAGWA